MCLKLNYYSSSLNVLFGNKLIALLWPDGMFCLVLVIQLQIVPLHQIADKHVLVALTRWLYMVATYRSLLQFTATPQRGSMTKIVSCHREITGSMKESRSLGT